MDAQLDWVVTAVGFVCVLGTFIICYLTFGRNKIKDNKEEAIQTAQITSDMGYVKGGIEGINGKLEKQDERHIEMIERVGRVEMSAQSAHKRIDHMEDVLLGR